MNAATQPMQTWEHRHGLIAAKIGRSFAIKLSVPMPLDGPMVEAPPVKGPRPSAPARTRLGTQNPHFAYTRNQWGENVAVRALPGATVYLDVQDITRLEPELEQHVRWVCTHQDCKGQKYGSKAELVRAHPNNKDLIKEAVQTQSHLKPSQAHVYYGLVEVAGQDAVEEKKDDKGKVIAQARPAQSPIIMIVSDEE